MSLSSIIEDVTGTERTLTVYDPADPEAIEDVKRHFEVQNVAVEEASAPEGPDDFAVLHDDGEFLAAADLGELRRAVTFEAGLLDADFEEQQYPDVLKHTDDTTFTAYEKRRMILASREIEERAWRTGEGELHAGFQRLSLFRDQWDRYARLGETGVSVHVYGEPDWQAPAADWLTLHEEDAPEVRGSWFVAFDAPEGTGCALVAEEREPDRFGGFWTYDEAVVGDVLGHLRETYP